MDKQDEKLLSDEAAAFKVRTFDNRVGTWSESVTALLKYLMDNDPEPDPNIKLSNAKTISSNLAIELTAEKITLFWMGVLQPLKDAVGSTQLIDLNGRTLVLSILNQEL